MAKPKVRLAWDESWSAMPESICLKSPPSFLGLSEVEEKPAASPDRLRLEAETPGFRWEAHISADNFVYIQPFRVTTEVTPKGGTTVDYHGQKKTVWCERKLARKPITALRELCITKSFAAVNIRQRLREHEEFVKSLNLLLRQMGGATVDHVRHKPWSLGDKDPPGGF